MGTLPTGFIATGPNIASQSLLFKQISTRLKLQVNGPVVTVRSGDVSNLKAALKQIIRDATNQKGMDEDEEPIVEQDVSYAAHLQSFLIGADSTGSQIIKLRLGTAIPLCKYAQLSASCHLVSR